MPRFDGTGPRGLGRMTGRKFGPCNPENAKPPATDEEKTAETSEQNVIYGVGRGGIPRGCGQGFCGGRGRRGNYRRW